MQGCRILVVWSLAVKQVGRGRNGRGSVDITQKAVNCEGQRSRKGRPTSSPELVLTGPSRAPN